ncbi:MAG: PadR family transcriptional regulator [Peptoniphilaceae bacterium]|nr:PadR family transcriptional regulator [Peptoniphilaceae bacterium]MDD7383418.1 PadR family transcriptional regulator [Peptoniphilaceae bacterium]MDY3738813.1 PadR family transcriptional regulator [Peptoniphilaceae bacterium]
MRDNLQSGALTETSLLILLSLYDELHGYGVKKLIEKMTDGKISLGMGTLYGAINKMLEKGWIKQSSQKANKVNYIITDLGREKVNNEERRLIKLLGLVNEVQKKHM